MTFVKLNRRRSGSAVLPKSLKREAICRYAMTNVMAPCARPGGTVYVNRLSLERYPASFKSRRCCALLRMTMIYEFGFQCFSDCHDVCFPLHDRECEMCEEDTPEPEPYPTRYGQIELMGFLNGVAQLHSRPEQ